MNSVGLKKKHHHAVVRVHGLAQHRHAHSGLRADQSRTEVVVLEHLKTSPCCRRALFCISSVPLFLYVRLGSRNVTSMNPKNDKLRYVPRNYQAPPNVWKFYVNILACCYDSSFRALSKIGGTSGCHIRLPQLLESLVLSVKHTCLMQLKWAKLFCAYTCLCIKLTKIIKW